MVKSNNFEFMSNIPKDVLELTYEICPYKPVCNDVCNPLPDCVAMLYAWRTINTGYVKQIEGEWIMKETLIRSPFAKNAYCSVCLEETSYAYNYCPNCGAKMKGANNE